MFTAGHKPTGSTSQTQNTKAQLAHAYNELGKELSSQKIRVVGNYTLGKVIGEGSYGKVRMGTHRLTSSRVAVKQIPKDASASLTREIHHHRQLHHPHIVQLYEVIATENSIWLVTELCSGGELFDYLVEKGRLSEEETRIVFGQLCLAVAYVHDKGIVHRDLKLENVLLDERCRVKLSDFGFTREFERGGFLETFCGTTGYASPEMLQGQRYLGPEVDVWSLGIILYTLLTGTLPFDDDDDSVMREKIILGDFEDPEWLSEDARALIKNIIQKDPTNRLSISQILAHPWFTKRTAVSPPPSPVASAPPEIAQHHPPALSPINTSVGSSNSGNAQQASEPPSTASSAFSEASFMSASSEPWPSTPTTPGDMGSNATHIDATPAPTVRSNSSDKTLKKTADEQAAEREDLPRASTSSAPPSRDPRAPPPTYPVRTPARTKRRSVSSALSESASFAEKPFSQLPPQDYASLLNTPAPMIFSTQLERELLNGLSMMGFDTAQIAHSVISNACDAAGALWWTLKRKSEKKALEDGDAHKLVKTESADPRSDDTPKERKRSRRRGSPSADRSLGKSSGAMLRAMSPTLAHTHSAPELAFVPPTPTVDSQMMPETPPLAGNGAMPMLLPTPGSSVIMSVPTTPSGSTGKEAGLKGRRDSKSNRNRSGSVSIMQRATTALEAAGLVRKKSTEAVKDKEEKERERERERQQSADDARSSYASSSKLTKSPPLKATKDKDPVSPATPSLSLEADIHRLGSPWVVTGNMPQTVSPPATTSTYAAPTPANSPGDTLTSLPNVGEAHSRKISGARNRASLLSAFRMWFNEDRKGKRKSPALAATSGPSNREHLQYQRSISSPGGIPSTLGRGKSKRRTSAGSVTGKPSSRHPAQGHRSKRASVSSRRSSSVNSRRSSLTGAQMVVLDSPTQQAASFAAHEPPLTLSMSMPAISRQRSDASRRSLGSRTPNSERGDYPSRPSSVRSLNIHRHRKSPSASSTGSAVRTSSPLPRHHRRAGSGSSTRVVRQLPSPTHRPGGRPPHVRSSSTNSIHSHGSSRPGSLYDLSETETQRTSSPRRAHASSSRRSLEEPAGPSSRRGSTSSSGTTFVAQKRRTPFAGGAGGMGRSSWKKSWGLEPPGWQSRTTHLPIEVLAVSPLIGANGSGADGPASLRDVFTGRQSLSTANGLSGGFGMGDESDWVDEDDDAPFVGGLGQLPTSSATTAATFGHPEVPTPYVLSAPPKSGKTPRAPVPAAAKRAARNGPFPATAGSGTSGRTKPGHTPAGRISPSPSEPVHEPSDSKGTRRQPVGRPTRSFRDNPIQEEDEEEEE